MKRSAVVIMVGLLIGVFATDVAADSGAGDYPPSTGASGGRTETGGSASVWGISTSGRAPHRGRGGGDVVCSLYTVAGGNSAFPGVGIPSSEFEAGDLAYLVCLDGNGRYASDPRLITVPEPVAPVSIDALIEQAVANLDIDLPEPVASPAGVTLPNLDTWFWVTNTAPQSRSASAAGITATVRSALVEVAFDFGAEGTLRCPGGGRPYDPAKSARSQTSTCTHAFSPPSRDLQVDVTATWRLTWSATNGASGDLGTVSRTSTLAVRVEERATVIRGA